MLPSIAKSRKYARIEFMTIHSHLMKFGVAIGLICLGLPLSAHSQSGIVQDEITEDFTTPGLEAFNVIPESAVKLEADGLQAAFSDVAHRGQYRFLRKATGTFAFTETTNKDGTLTHVQGEEVLRGIWEIEDDQICYTYERIWTYPVCFNIYKSGTCYYHLLRSSNGIAQYVVTARSTPAKQRPDCDLLAS